MKNLRERGLEPALQSQVIQIGIPCLGICLGMQLLATKGYEGGEVSGLGWIPGEVNRMVPDNLDTRLPHVGWNELVIKEKSLLFQDIPNRKDFYFVHSYHFQCQQSCHEIAYTPYCSQFTSVVAHNNVLGVQFHPEKSQKVGFQVLKNFLTHF